MNSRQHLAEDLDRLKKRTQQVGWVAWAVAIFVMIYGTPIVYGLATAHGIPAGVAWMLSLAADAALVVGLIATPVLAQLGIKAGWVGTLRWVSGGITWALQTASSWIAAGGPDWVGVGVHTAGPLLLFFVVEAASYFQRKVSAAIEMKARALAAAEQSDADRRTHLAETESALRARTAELTAARTELESLTERLTAVGHHADRTKTELALTGERYENEIASLRKALTDQRDTLTAEHEEAVRRLREKHREALTEARAAAGAVSLTAYRNRATGNGRQAGTGKSWLSDEDAVQMMLTAHSDPNHEWSQNAVRTLTGVGLGRAPKLIDLWLTAVTEKAANGKAVNE
ncbi:hypothetical protein AB0F72_08830 [Actinoplanes sp. NPDC023936]|uniref:hypothetical protein n=1 Tax=Actinoplanes sp. NPDC023936 TaxID=3154910 RepID=UPI0033FA002D